MAGVTGQFPAVKALSLVIPPQRGGVWDLTYAVADQLGRAGDVVALTPANVNVLEGKNVLLQYSGYGYARKGAPLWLLREIRARRARFGMLGVFFHELYATGPPWKSAFWLSSAQRLIARRLAETADFWLASCEAYGQWLRQYAQGKPHAVMPVPSNVGEPARCPGRRRPMLVVFGGAPLRQSTYRTGGEMLLKWARQEGLELHDIGPPIQDRGLIQCLRSVKSTVHGSLDGKQVSQLLAEALYGAVAYRGDALAKSGVFAAYCAHGACPIVLADQPVLLDGLLHGRTHHEGIPPTSFPASSATQIGEAAWSWYQSHRLECHVAAIHRLMREAERGEICGQAGTTL